MRRTLQLLALFAAGLLVYGPALRGAWLWDDGLEVADNPLLRDPAGWWKAWTGPAGLDYLPLKTLLQWAEWHLWHDHVLGYHVVNVLLHVTAAALLWKVLAQLDVPWAWLGGLIFLVHPMAVESVAWIAEFKNVLSLNFLLLAVLAWLAPGWYVAALGCFLLALCSKASVVMLPCCLLLIAWWHRGRLTRADLLASAPFFAASLVWGAVTLHFQWHRAMGLAGVPPAAPAGRWAGWNVLGYLRSALLPVHLSPVYGPWRAGPFWLPWLALALLAAVLWLCPWRRAALFAAGWFVLSLLPILGFVPMAYLRVGPRADHLGYLALLAVAGGAAALLGRWGTRAAAVVAVALVVTLAAASHVYARAFRSELSLWTLAAARQPDAWLARANLGRAWLDAGQAEQALPELAAAAALQPDSTEVQVNWANALMATGRWPEALARFHAAIHLAPNFAGARYDLGRAWLERGEPAAAEAELREAVRMKPNYADAHNNLGLALMRQGRTDDAVAEYRTALALDPGLAPAHVNLGNAFYARGRSDLAAAEYRAALRIAPDYGPARMNLARLGSAGGPP